MSFRDCEIEPGTSSSPKNDATLRDWAPSSPKTTTKKKTKKTKGGCAPTKWEAYAKSKRVFAIGLLVSVVSALVITLGILSYEIHVLRRTSDSEGSPTASSSSDSVCLTEECTVASAQVLERIDAEADPCADFFQYACGGFNDQYYLPKGQTHVSQFSVAAQRNDMMILHSIDANASLPGTARAFSSGAHSGREDDARTKAKKYYDGCLDTRQMDRRGIAPIEDLLAIPDFLLTYASGRGGNTSGSPFSKRGLVFGALRELQKRHIRILTDTYISEDRETAEMVLNVRQGLLGLPDATYFTGPKTNTTTAAAAGRKHAKILKAYEASLLQGLNLLESRTVQAFSSATDAAVKSMIAFETKIAACHVPKEVLLAQPLLTHNPMTIEEAEVLYPFGFSEFIESVSGRSNYTGRINVETPSALACMARVLDEAAIEDIALYMKTIILMHRSEILDRDLRRWSYRFNLATRGESGEGPRWRQCMDLVSSHQRFGWAISKPYVARAFSRESKAQVQEILENLEVAFMDLLPSVTWMEPSTRDYAVRKARAMKKHMGYPDWILDDAKVSGSCSLSLSLSCFDTFSHSLILFAVFLFQVNAYYENVTVEDGMFYENTIALMKDHQRKSFEKLFESANATGSDDEDSYDWIMSPTEINAYYSALTNTIAFPAAILQSPFFTEKAPLPLNYGSIGTFIGHEFTHGFDNNGRKYGLDGRLEDWWMDQDDEHFEERAQCFVDQYGSYEIHGHFLDGNLTLAENLADNAGLALAFDAFTKAMASKKLDRLPSTPWSVNQLFFLGFAQAWCSTIKEDKALNLLRTDPHALPRFRVNGAVTNSPDFAEAFQCPLGTPMNPERTRCELWN